MTDQQRTDESVLKANTANQLQGNKSAADARTAPNSHGGADDVLRTTASQNLTAEEQMALYEKALKEEDWGHQPC